MSHRRPKHFKAPLNVRKKKVILKRWMKNSIHGTLLSGIIFSYATEGGKIVDWLFVALAVVCELHDEN